MSTNCRIGKINEDGTVRSIYCHHDGYVDYVGKKLLDFYDKNNIDQLLDLGDISALGNNPVSSPDGWKLGQLFSEEECVAYKDRGEDCPAEISKSVEEFLGLCRQEYMEYYYLYDTARGLWFYGTCDDFTELKCLDRNDIESGLWNEGAPLEL